MLSPELVRKGYDNTSSDEQLQSSKFQIRPQTLYFCQYIRILSRVPVPLMQQTHRKAQLSFLFL
jgi:hypothetical protein